MRPGRVLCEDAACYEAVNGLDPFCDDNNWDEFCVACAASQPGYAGLDCSSVGAACETEKVVSPCAEQASCMDTEGSFTCTCDAGYEGDGFSCANIDECAQEPHRVTPTLNVSTHKADSNAFVERVILGTASAVAKTGMAIWYAPGRTCVRVWLTRIRWTAMKTASEMHASASRNHV